MSEPIYDGRTAEEWRSHCFAKMHEAAQRIVTCDPIVRRTWVHMARFYFHMAAFWSPDLWREPR